jgi:hypothetical protein
MAYVSQDLKKSLAPRIKAILKKYRLKGSLSVRHHSTLVLTIKSGAIDFISNHNRVVGQRVSEGSLSVNPYWYQDHFDGQALAALRELLPAMNRGNYNNSDIQTDYFDVGWYVDVNIGKWNKPYTVEA